VLQELCRHAFGQVACCSVHGLELGLLRVEFIQRNTAQ
jgi:hypothetical protein